MDLAMRHFTGGRKAFDAGGRWAASGKVCGSLLVDWLRHPFFRAGPPKSTGREVFGETFFATALRRTKTLRLSKFDVLATFTALTARSLVLNYRRHLPSAPAKVILSGGGSSNPTLRRMITDALREWSCETTVITTDGLGWPAQAIEPAAFAFLAWRRMQGRTGNLPKTTGASRPMLLGQITEPTPRRLNAAG
jgi:anhydro-N-acetylmuramic acid kinase